MTEAKKNKLKELLMKGLLVIALLLITISILFPVYFVGVTSFKKYSQYIVNPFGIQWQGASLNNYQALFRSNNLLRAFFNSALISLFSVVCTVLFSALGAFAIGVIRFKGSKFFYNLAIITMFFTGELTYVPLYLLYSQLHLTNTYWVLLIPCLLSYPSLGLVLGANYLQSIPREIHEAALMDGSSLKRMFFQIDLPLMRPILAMIAIMTFQSAWSEFFWPMITVLGNADLYTLPLLVLQYKAADSSMFGQYCASLTTLTIPIIILYVFFSRYFIEGMTAGAVKS